MTFLVVSQTKKRAACQHFLAALCALTVFGSSFATAEEGRPAGDGSAAVVGLTEAKSGTAAVQVPSMASGLSEQRYNYNLAKSAFRAGDMDEYRHYYELLGDYPLVPYLDYSALRAQLSDMSYDAVDAFFTKYPGSFLATRLRQTWLSQLAAQDEWQAFVRYYRAEVATTEHECQYIYARVQNGDENALQQTARLWDVGESQPKACDPLFNQWRASDFLTQELIWSRFSKAMQQRNRGLGRYLAAMLKDDYQKMAQLYLRVDHQPSLIMKHNEFRHQNPLIQPVIAHGIRRLARTRADLAQKHWELYEAQQLFSEDLSRDTKVHLVRYLTRQGHQAQAEQLLQNSAALRQTDVVEELLREALRELDWQAVERRVQMLPEEEQASDRWRYWRARAIGELKLAVEGFPEPAQVYESLAENRSFYGFLAADLLDLDYALEDVPVEVRPEALKTTAELPGMARAKELWLTGNYAEARAEWMFTTRTMSKTDLVSAGQLAREWGWYNKGIHAMIAGDLWDHLAIRFPLAYQEEVTRVAQDMQLDATLIYAIARQESAFAEDARSPSGARGLMQLMPSTAAQIARRNGVKHSVTDLYNPEHNILLGSRYFNTLLERFNNNRILATAAYNAGPHRVSNWISNTGKERPFDVWIETIPYRETRGYVQNVLSFSVIYGYRLGLATHLVTAREAQDLL